MERRPSKLTMVVRVCKITLPANTSGAAVVQQRTPSLSPPVVGLVSVHRLWVSLGRVAC